MKTSMKRDPARGRRIRALRKEVGLTQTGLANRVGIQSLKTIQRWESGEPIQTNNLAALAEAVGATVETILGLPERQPMADPLAYLQRQIDELNETVDRMQQLIAERPQDPAALRREAEALAQQDDADAPPKRGRGRKR